MVVWLTFQRDEVDGEDAGRWMGYGSLSSRAVLRDETSWGEPKQFFLSVLFVAQILPTWSDPHDEQKGSRTKPKHIEMNKLEHQKPDTVNRRTTINIPYRSIH